MMKRDALLYVAGHQGLVGSALIRLLAERGYTNIITRTFAELDLRNQRAVNNFFMQHKPEYVFLAAARVGGIKANDTYPADFMYDNLMIQTNVIHAAYRSGVKKLLFLGSSCIYPRDCAQPIKEEYLLTGPLEQTNEWYALAKIAGLKLCQAYNKQFGTCFIVAMPTNLYGPGDSFDLQNAHVIPALIAKCVAARESGAPEMVLWGTGTVRREFLYVDDLAKALLILMEKYTENYWINVGCGVDYTIAEIAQMIAQLVGFKGRLVYDTAMPDGTRQKLLDISSMRALQWTPEISLEQGLRTTIAWYESLQRNKV